MNNIPKLDKTNITEKFYTDFIEVIKLLAESTDPSVVKTTQYSLSGNAVAKIYTQQFEFRMYYTYNITPTAFSAIFKGQNEFLNISYGPTDNVSYLMADRSSKTPRNIVKFCPLGVSEDWYFQMTLIDDIISLSTIKKLASAVDEYFVQRIKKELELRAQEC